MSACVTLIALHRQSTSDCPFLNDYWSTCNLAPYTGTRVLCVGLRSRKCPLRCEDVTVQLRPGRAPKTPKERPHE